MSILRNISYSKCTKKLNPKRRNVLRVTGGGRERDLEHRQPSEQRLSGGGIALLAHNSRVNGTLQTCGDGGRVVVREVRVRNCQTVEPGDKERGAVLTDVRRLEVECNAVAGLGRAWGDGEAGERRDGEGRIALRARRDELR